VTANRTRRNQVSPEGRERQAEAGRKNLSNLKASRQTRREIREETAALRRDLLAKLGPNAHPGKRSLTLSAAASHAAIALVLQQILGARSHKSIQMLTGLLPTMQSSLLRTLNALGITTQDSGDDPNGAVPALETAILDFAREQQDGDEKPS
jgi:hypothetical protein